MEIGLQALTNPYTMVLSEREAIRFFGRTDVVGETVRIAGWDNTQDQEFRITGVLASTNYNSVTYIGPYEQHVFIPLLNANLFFEGVDFDTDWSVYNTVTFVQLDENTNPSTIEAQLSGVLETHLPDGLRDRVSLAMMPLVDLHLSENEGAVGRLVLLLLLIAAVILVIACFNFVNISVSLATVRSREVGLRKVLGAARRQLMGQFIGESVLISCVSMLVALLLVVLLLPLFNSLVDRDLALDLSQGWVWGLVGAVIMGTGFISGGYPALFLSAMQPVRALKELVRTGVFAMQLRRTLVVLQFVVAISMIIATVFIGRQVSFIANMDVGFDRDQLLVVSSLPRTWTQEGVQQLEIIKQDVKSIPGVEDVSVAWGPPGPRYTGVTMALRKEGEDLAQAVSIPVSQVDPGFLNTVGLQLIEGAFFDAGSPVSDSVVVINQAAARAFGWEEDAVDQRLYEGTTAFRVAGVVEDYNTLGLEQPVGPVVLVDVRQFPLYRELLVRVEPGSLGVVQSRIAEAWRDVYPGVVFQTYIVEDQWDQAHRWISRTGEITQLAAGLSIFIALIGLLGLVSINVGQRTREIGVRKVLGANLFQLLRLLSSEYVALITIAFCIAAPLAYLGIEYWLEGFVNRIAQQPIVFFMVGVVLVLTALITISLQTLRAALTNPIKSLRHE